MFKFIEVYEKPLEYNSELGTCKSDFSLREIYINPRYIIAMKKSQELNANFKTGAWVKDLNKNAEFTELTVQNSHNSPKIYNVVGDAQTLINKMTRP